MRASLVERTRDVLGRAGYFLSRESKLRPMSFDLVARRDDHLLIVKVLANVDALAEPVASELVTLGDFLEATPLVIGERSSSRELDRGAVYERHGIPILAFETLSDWLIEGVPPLVFAGPGGFYVKLDGPRLRTIRAERGLSLGQIAEAAGVSRRAVSMYEDGMAAMVEVALRIEQFLDEPLVLPVDPWTLRRDVESARADIAGLSRGWERDVLLSFSRMGFRVAPVDKTPFDALTKRDDVVLTGIAETDADLARKAECVANLAEVTETFAAFVVHQRTTRTELDGAAVIGRDELARVDDAKAFVDLIRERVKRGGR